MDEGVIGAVGDGLQVGEIAGVSQFVEIDEGRSLLLKPAQDKVRADKSGAARDQNGWVGDRFLAFGGLISI